VQRSELLLDAFDERVERRASLDVGGRRIGEKLPLMAAGVQDPRDAKRGPRNLLVLPEVVVRRFGPVSVLLGPRTKECHGVWGLGLDPLANCGIEELER
jgi:hypothetical protein